MPFTWQIRIEKSASSAGYLYSPTIIPDVSIGDQVIFTNNDDRPHFPGLLAGPAGPANPTYFMAYQVPGGASSNACVPSMPGTFRYADSLDTRSARPVGSVVVLKNKPAGPETLASRNDA